MPVSVTHPTISWEAYEAHRRQGGTDAAFAASLGLRPDNFAHHKQRWKRNGQPDTPAHQRTPKRTRTPNSAVQDSAEPVQSSAEILADHETRLQVLESFIATLQTQALQAHEPRITVQSSVYALPSADAVQTWDNPEDAKPERWNFWIPRGLKRRLEAQAHAAGIPPSQLVQRLLALAESGVRDA